METTIDSKSVEENSRVDHIGIWASVLCAIHCALTPVLLILLPTFGKAWSHPATHWGMALVVIPIAVFMMRKGFQKHRKKWLLGVGSLGIVFIITGSILPYLEVGQSNDASIQTIGMERADPIETETSEAVG